MYSIEGRVRFSECSANGRLSIGGLIDYFQDTSTFHAEDAGMGQEYLRRDNRAWIINYWQVEIDSLPKLGERITVSTWPYMFRKFIGNRNFLLKDEKGQICARADSIWALYDMEKGFPASMTKEELEGYEVEPRLDMEEKSRKIRVDGEFSPVDTFVIGRDRLDTNIHVNNGQYIKLGCNYIPEDRDVASVRVEYKTSIKLGDKVSVSTCEKDGLLYIRFDDEAGNEYSVLEFGFK